MTDSCETEASGLLSVNDALLKISKSEVNIITGITSRHKLLSLPETAVIFFKDYLTGN